MSESDGLQKLTAYLNQTRRQAEAAVDALNVQIEDLRKENELYEQLCKKLEQEKDYFKNLSDQLKVGGTTKQALKERDDWRALIESVQSDRSRLQEECCALESALDVANQDIANLKEQVESLSGAALQNTASDSTASPSQRSLSRTLSTPTSSQNHRNLLTIQCDTEIEDRNHCNDENVSFSLVSPILDRNGQEVELNLTGSPRNVVRQLQIELKRAYNQLTTERQQAEAERLSHQLEISRLHEQYGISHPATSSQRSANTTRTYVLNGTDDGFSKLIPAPSAVVPTKHTSTIEWFNPLGYIGYWLGGSSSSSSHTVGDVNGGTIIIKV